MKILNPLSTLGELKKYMAIVEMAKKAVARNSKGLPVDDLNDQLELMLDNCGSQRWKKSRLQHTLMKIVGISSK